MKPKQDRPPGPYRPIWVDHLIARLDALPLPLLAVYLGLWLAMRIGVGWAILIYTGPLAFPDVLENMLWMTAALLLVLSIGLSFVATLADIHRRIGALKAQKLANVHELLERVFAELDRRIRAGQMEGLADLHEAARALELQRGMLARVSTWLWQPGTLASFVTALSLAAAGVAGSDAVGPFVWIVIGCK